MQTKLLLNDITELARSGGGIIAVEGRCCSGKTSFAAMLQKRFECNVFHMDDFFLTPELRTPQRLAEPGGNVDYERFLQEVLLPLTRKEDINLKAWNCHTAAFKPVKKVLYKSLNIIEGSYCLHPALAKHYNYRVFMTVDAELQKERIIKRGGSAVLEQFIKKWIPLEELYLSVNKPEVTCNYTLYNWNYD